MERVIAKKHVDSLALTIMAAILLLGMMVGLGFFFVYVYFSDTLSSYWKNIIIGGSIALGVLFASVPIITRIVQASKETYTITYDEEEDVFHICVGKTFYTIYPEDITDVEIRNTHVHSSRIGSMHTLHVYHTRFGKVVIYYDDGGRERKIKSNLVDEVEDAAYEIIDIVNSDDN